MFNGPSLEPKNGEKTDSLVVFIHGYGANGDNLLALGESWATHLPKTAFIAPNGPRKCEGSGGYQWFGLMDWDSQRILQEIHDLTDDFNAFLDEQLKARKLQSDRLALVGFSQGTVFALHLGLRRQKCAALIGYSGAFINVPNYSLIARPPVLLVHGLEDMVISADSSELAQKELQDLKVPVEAHFLPKLSHTIDIRGMELGGEFLQKGFYDKST